MSAIHKRDPLAVVLIVYGERIKLMNAKRIIGNSFRDFGLRFNVQLSRFISLATHDTLLQPISALMLLANSTVDTNQRVSLIAAASTATNPINPKNVNENMSLLVMY